MHLDKGRSSVRFALALTAAAVACVTAAPASAAVILAVITPENPSLSIDTPLDYGRPNVGGIQVNYVFRDPVTGQGRQASGSSYVAITWDHYLDGEYVDSFTSDFATTGNFGGLYVQRFYDNNQLGDRSVPVRGVVELDLVGLTSPIQVRVSFIPFLVPEPGTWAMLIGGTGAVGTRLRTRRKRNAFA